MGKHRVKKDSGGIEWIDPSQALADLRAAAGNSKRAALLAGRVMTIFGPAGARALLRVLNMEDPEFTPSAETQRSLAKALLATPEGIAAAVEYWPSLTDGAKLHFFRENLPPAFLPLCLEAAESTNPGLKLYACLSLAVMQKPEAAEGLFDLAYDIGLPYGDRVLTLTVFLKIFYMHGARACPSIWGPDERRSETIISLIQSFTEKHGLMPCAEAWDDHTAVLFQYLKDPDPRFRRQAVELSVPERVLDEDWLRLLRDPDAKVRFAAAKRAPVCAVIRQELLQMLVEEPDPETRSMAARRLKEAKQDSFESVAKIVMDKKIDKSVREGLAELLGGRIEADNPSVELRPVAESLSSDEDFRLRWEGYRLLRLLDGAVDPGEEDAALLELPEIGEGEALDLGRRLAGFGPRIVPALIEALAVLPESEPRAQVKETCLRRLGADAVLPILVAIIEESDIDRAAEAALALGSLAPDPKVWQTLLDLWQGERNDTVRYAMLLGACYWPTWRAGFLLLQIIGGDYSTRLKKIAIRLAVDKGVPGLADLALRMLLGRQNLPLVNDLFQALVKLYVNKAIPLEWLEKLLNESDPATARLMWDVKESAEKMKEGRGEEWEEEEDAGDILRLNGAWEDDE